MKATFITLAAITTVVRLAAGADIIYVAEEQLTRVSIVRSNGSLYPFATGLGLVYGLELDAEGNLYVAGMWDDVVFKITPSGYVNAFARGELLGSPMGMVFDDAGNLFTTGFGWGGTINRLGTNGTITRVVTGIGGTDLARDSAGNLYVSASHSVIKLAPNGVMTTVASGFQLPWGLAFDPDGNLFVADYLGDTISKVTPGGAVSLFASGMDRPTGLAFDSHGDLFVCNITMGQPLGYLSKVTPDGTVSIFASGLNYPTAIAICRTSVAVETNHPPVAQCTNVVVSADSTGAADASVDNGSFDPDGDPIAVTQTPPGPYSLGTNEVLLTVTDSHGASDSCQATVTVADTIPPVIWSAAAQPNVLWPPNHKLVSVNLTVRVSDNCGPATWTIVRVQSNDPANPHGKGNRSPDWIITGNHTLQLRAERANGRADRVYTIAIQATDPSGNRSALTSVAVTVPANQGR